MSVSTEFEGPETKIIEWPITWRDVAIWLDTEGTAAIYKHHGRLESVIHIAQKERAPLEVLRAFVASQGIVCKVRTSGKSTGMHVLEIKPVISQFEFLVSVRPYMMTVRQSRRVDRLIEFLRERRRVKRRRKGLSIVERRDGQPR